MLYIVTIWGVRLTWWRRLSAQLNVCPPLSEMVEIQAKPGLDTEVIFTAEDVRVGYWGVNTTNFQTWLSTNSRFECIYVPSLVSSTIFYSLRHVSFHTLMSTSPPLPLLLLFLHHVNCLLLMLNMECFAFCKQLAWWAPVLQLCWERVSPCVWTVEGLRRRSGSRRFLLNAEPSLGPDEGSWETEFDKFLITDE